MRNFILTGFLLLTCVITILTACQQKTSEKTKDTITWIEDKPGPTMQNHSTFPEVPDSLWNELGLQEGVPSSMSCVLLQTEGKNILFDAGLGAPFSQLLVKIEEMGVTADKVDLVYITHMHGDHIGGMLKEDTKVFTNAEVYINRIEAEAWLAMPEEKSALARKVLDVYKENLHYFEAGDTLEGHILTIEAYGHTPGHTVFQKDDILIIGDLMHGAALQMEHPEYCAAYDMDKEAAIEARVHILEYARKNGLTMYGMHLPSPGTIE